MNAQRAFATGRGETARRWLTWFEEENLVEQYPAVAVLGALFYISMGEPTAAERWTDAAEHPSPAPLPDGSPGEQRTVPERILPDGSTLASWRALLRSQQSPSGLDAMRRDAEAAIDGLSAASGLRASALAVRGMPASSAGTLAAADSIFAQAVDVGMGAGAGPSVMIALAERGFCAMQGGDWPAVQSFVEEASSAVQEFGLGEYTASALSFVLAARAALHRGDVERARDDLTRAARLRPLLDYCRPTYSVRTLLELARAYVALEDTAGAREVLRQAQDILQKRPDLGVLPKEVEELESRLDAMRTGAGRPVVAHRGGAPTRAVPSHPPHVPADRRAALPLPQHREVPGDLDLSEAGCLVS